MSDFVENVVITLEKYEKMRTQIEKLTKENEKLIEENEKLIEKFYKPFVKNNITKEQFNDIVKQLENSIFTVTTFEDAESQKIRVMLELKRKNNEIHN